MKAQPGYEGASEAERRELDRVGAFSDGVFAIAITLLVLNIEVPDVAAEDLGSALRDLDGSFTAYFIGFAVMGKFWYEHHRLFSAITRTDIRLIVSNLVLLCLISLMPFTTALLGSYDRPAAISIYALNVAAAALASGVTEVIAANGGLAPPGALGERSGIVRANIVIVGVFLLSIPISFFSTALAQWSWASLLVISRARKRFRSRQEDGRRTP